MSSILSNRRKHPRIPIRATIKVRIGWKTLYPIKVSNISMGGMCVHMEQSIEMGKTGKLWLTQEDIGEVVPFVTKFKIRRVDPPVSNGKENIIGIEFLNMNRKYQDNLLKILRIQGSHA